MSWPNPSSQGLPPIYTVNAVGPIRSGQERPHTHGDVPPSGSHPRVVIRVNEAPSNRTQSPPFTGSFADKHIRHAFIRKVYLILMVQLLFTAAITVIFLTVEAIKVWVRYNWWILILAFILYFVSMIVMTCCPSVRRKYPGNYICLGILTASLSLLCGCLTSYFSTRSVLIALLITVVVCVAVTIFAVQVKFDFTMCAGLLFVMSMCLMLFGMSCLIVYLVSGPNYILQCVYGSVAALLLSMYLVFDTQMIFGGRTIQLSPEDYIGGAMHLYIDICTLFMVMVGLTGYIQ